MKNLSKNVRALMRRGAPAVFVLAVGCPGPPPPPAPSPPPVIKPDPRLDEPTPSPPAPLDSNTPIRGRLGRPLRVKGQQRRARVVEGSTWHEPAREPDLTSLSRSTRERLATEWLRDARDEHASIAAFARLSLELLALGAPPELLEQAQRAALDEIEHARMCFTLASHYAGRELDPGIFHEATTAPTSRESHLDRLGRVAAESLVDGGFGEGTASALAARAAEGAKDPVVRQVLGTIATDEARHAKLGWAVVGWCLEVGGKQVADRVSEALGEVSRERAARRRGLPEHGRLGTKAIGEVTGEVRAVVLARGRDLVRRSRSSTRPIASVL